MSQRITVPPFLTYVFESAHRQPRRIISETSYGTTCNACGLDMPSLGRDANAKKAAERLQKTALCDTCIDKGYEYVNGRLVKSATAKGYKLVGHSVDVNLIDKNSSVNNTRTLRFQMDVYQKGSQYFAKPTGGRDTRFTAPWYEVRRVNQPTYTYQMVKTTPDLVKIVKQYTLR